MRALLPISLSIGVAAAQSIPHGKTIAAIAREANGTVVSIVMSDKEGHPIAQGSGFLVSKDGRVLTNYHVIQHGSSAVIKLPDGAFFVIEGILAFDKDRDIAVIKTNGENFRSVVLGDSDRVQVGSEVVAIGNPLSLESTVSNGIISGVRTLKKEGAKYLQITAPISPGSSGGPLFSMAGEVVGITTSYLRGGENLNFAIPINDVKPLLATRSSKIEPFPNEGENSKLHGNSEQANAICSFIQGRILEALPQAPTLCDEASPDSVYPKVSVFSPVPVLPGNLRRAWSTALFQALQAAAKDGPCRSGCSISVSDAQMALRGMHYETDISKDTASLHAEIFPQIGGFASDQAYFWQWSYLLSGTRDDRLGSQEGTESLARNACQDYSRLLREDRMLAELLKQDPKLLPGLPTCSVMVPTPSSAYIVVDFSNSFMPTFADFSDPLPKAFHYLDRYEGAVIFRGPWATFSDGTTARYYQQYSLHWLGFVHDEMTSGVRDEGMSFLLLNGDHVRQPGQIYPNAIFGKDSKVGTIVTREAAVYKIKDYRGYARVQLTDGSEWAITPDSVTRCGLKVGDAVSLFAVKSVEADRGISPAKANCNLKASFAGAW